ncbi:CYP2U1 [Branchiostoma lanceolatum]|uniref:CYP2U1 protein n=1 Tax=Branchiostoma lanceolatum TaxID=7740 RepID=A0A8K0F3S7_BRALA|nr:CYP2U1 [Branchiostoma lanceolatum]
MWTFLLFVAAAIAWPDASLADLLTEGGKDIAFTDYNPTWKLHRKLFHSATRGYASGQNLQSRVHESLKETMAELSKMEGRVVDLEGYIYNLVYNVICSAAFGVRYNMDDEEFNTLIKLTKDTNEVFGQGLLADVYPLLRPLPTPTIYTGKKLAEQFLGILGRHLEHHRETFDPSNLRDITDHMIKAQKDAEEEGIYDVTSLTDCHLRQTIADVFFGGTDTTIIVIRWAILFLAAHPEIQEKVAAELDSAVGRDRLPELSDRETTPYMEAAIHEVMRMGSIAPLSIPRASTVDTTLRGYDIPKGTWIMPNLWALHHDPATWGDPDVFRPERFLDENGMAIPKPAALMPFSAGRRACPGEAVAKADTFLLLGGLVQNFRFSIPEGDGPPDFTPDERGGSNFSLPSPYKFLILVHLYHTEKKFRHHNDWPVYNSTIHFNMKFINYVLPFLLISAFILESDAWWRSRRRRRSSGCSTAPRALARTSRDGCTSPYTNLETCTYRCLFGYIKVSGSTIRTCYNGRWTGTNLVCGTTGAASCRGSPPTVWNTIRSGCTPPYGQAESCHYRCIPGWSRVSGSTYRRCSFGHWLGTDLVCRYTATLPCSAPPIRTWSYRYGCLPPFTHGERCSFACRRGAPRTGSPTRTCNNGVWSGTPLECVLPYQ